MTSSTYVAASISQPQTSRNNSSSNVAIPPELERLIAAHIPRPRVYPECDFADHPSPTHPIPTHSSKASSSLLAYALTCKKSFQCCIEFLWEERVLQEQDDALAFVKVLKNDNGVYGPCIKRLYIGEPSEDTVTTEEDLRITAELMKVIAEKCPNLQSLCLTFNGTTNHELPWRNLAERLMSLEHFHLHADFLPDDLGEETSQMGEFLYRSFPSKGIVFQHIQMNTFSPLPYTCFATLETLTLDLAEFATDGLYDAISHCQNLRHFRVTLSDASTIIIPDSIIRNLMESCVNLETLHIHAPTEYIENSLQRIGDLTNLTSVAITSANNFRYNLESLMQNSSRKLKTLKLFKPLGIESISPHFLIRSIFSFPCINHVYFELGEAAMLSFHHCNQIGFLSLDRFLHSRVSNGVVIHFFEWRGENRNVFEVTAGQVCKLICDHPDYDDYS